MGYKSYEESDVWQRGVALAVAIYSTLNACKEIGLIHIDQYKKLNTEAKPVVATKGGDGPPRYPACSTA